MLSEKLKKSIHKSTNKEIKIRKNRYAHSLLLYNILLFVTLCVYGNPTPPEYRSRLKYISGRYFESGP